MKHACWLGAAAVLVDGFLSSGCLGNANAKVSATTAAETNPDYVAFAEELAQEPGLSKAEASLNGCARRNS